jgi:hypothetical protein
MTKIEEVAQSMHARAIVEGADCPPWNELEPEQRVQAVSMARAAVEALRVPSEAMITAAYDVQAYWHHDVSELESEWRDEMRKEYQAAIDAILKEKA